MVQSQMKIYFLAHPRHFLQSDIMCIGIGIPRCDTCSYPLARPDGDVLQFYWEDEFGDPEESQRSGHQLFFGSEIIATKVAKTVLKEFPLAFYETRLVETKYIRNNSHIIEVPQPEEPFFWISPTLLADAAEDNPNTLCPACGGFVDQGRASQRTRLRVKNGPAVAAGLFGVRQNRGQYVFVTEQGKARLEQLNLGVGFYPAGRVVEQA